MEQRLLDADNEMDSKTPTNFTGAQLYNCGMAVADGHWIMVKYDTVKKANTAANICGNKCRIEGTKNVFTVRRSTDKYGVAWLTIAKVPDYVRLQQKCIDVMSISHNSETVKAQQAERNALECDNNPAYAAYVGNMLEEEGQIARMLQDAMVYCAQGRTDDYMKGQYIPDEIIAKARANTLTEKRAEVVFLPGADDDWDRTNWSEEQVRNDTILFNRIKHARRLQLKDPITIAEEQNANKEAIAAICAEVDATAAEERKEARKKELTSKKTPKPEKYAGVEDTSETLAIAVTAPLLTREGKRSKLQIEMDLADAAAASTRTFTDCLLDGTVEQFKAMRKDEYSEHDIALKLGLREDVAVQLAAFIDTVN